MLSRLLIFFALVELPLPAMETQAIAFQNEPRRRLEAGTNSQGYRLMAYPATLDNDTEVYFEISVPVLVDYILGTSWKDEVKDHVHRMPILDVPTDGNWTDADETALALRILRVGEAIIDLSSANGVWWRINRPNAWYAEERVRDFVYGWPETGKRYRTTVQNSAKSCGGGVWSLRVPGPPRVRWEKGEVLDTRMIEEIVETMESPERFEPIKRAYNGYVNLGTAGKSKTMDEWCDHLKDQGAVFYDRIEDCEEAVKDGLVTWDGAVKVARERRERRHGEGNGDGRGC